MSWVTPWTVGADSACPVTRHSHQLSTSSIGCHQEKISTSGTISSYSGTWFHSQDHTYKPQEVCSSSFSIKIKTVPLRLAEAGRDAWCQILSLPSLGRLGTRQLLFAGLTSAVHRQACSRVSGPGYPSQSSMWTSPTIASRLKGE